jgi:hypothetical protein
MKLRIILTVIIVMVGGVTLFAQPPGTVPGGAGDKNLGDDNIKLRSVELERIKKEAQAAEAASYAPINPKLTAQFGQVKDDYEAVQLLQASIIKAYTTGKTINYAMIETSADAITKRALRLDSNLFASTKKDKIETKSEEKKEASLSIRDLIVNLDNAIGDFVSSPIFGKQKVIEPEVAIKTRDDLSRILKFSEYLTKEAKKLR